jgi:hypothetical protein
MSGHGIGAGNKRRSHQTGSPCPICDGSFKATDPDVGYRQETSDDSQVYSGRTTDLPRHMASVHGLKASSEYALHVESASLKRQPSLFSFMRRAAAPPQNIQEASSGSAGGDRGEEHGTLSEDGGGDEQMSDEETILPDSPRSGRFDISNFTVLLTKAVAPVLDLLATVNGTIKSLPLRVAEEVVKLQEKVKTSRSLADKALAKCGTAQEIGRCSTFKVSPDENSLLCMPCIQQKKTTLSSGQFHLKGENMARFGVVKLQDVSDVKPREFKTVKQAVKEHLQTSGHTMCLEAFHGEDMHRNKVQRAGLAVARSALKTVREAQSFRFFEREIFDKHVDGVNVGNLNHSRDFITRFIPAMYSVLVKRIHTFLTTPQANIGGRLPPFCITADKMTALRRTGQCVGMLTMEEGQIGALLIGHDPVGMELSGPQVARHTLKSLERFVPSMPELKQSLTGQAYDGAYFHDSVPSEFCKLVDMNLEWVLAFHDGAHRIELVFKDARGGVRPDGAQGVMSTFYGKVAPQIGEILSTFTYGKAYEKALSIATELGVNFRQPQAYCDTRFVAAEYKVYVNYLENWEVYHTFLHEQLTQLQAEIDRKLARKTVKTISKDDTASLKSLTSRMALCVSFHLVGSVIGLRDIFEWTRKLSLYMQKVNVLPWEILERSFALHDQFVRAASDMMQGTPSPEDFPNLMHDNIASFRAEGEFHKVQLSVENDDPISEALARLYSDLGTFIYTIAQSFKKRILLEFNPKLYDMLVCLDVRKFAMDARYGRGDMAVEVFKLKRLYFWFTTVGRITLPPWTAIIMQHFLVKDRLRKVYTGTQTTSGLSNVWKDASGTVIMKFMFTSDVFSNGVEDWLYMFNHCALKSMNEAVVEGMGCIVDQHAAPERHLSMETYSKEAMIHYNAPMVHEAESFLKDSLDVMFEKNVKKGWHFVARDSKYAVDGTSEVIKRMKLASSKFSFMK